MMLNTTELYSLIPVYLCRHSAVKLNEATQMFLMVDNVREVTVKTFFKCGEYG